MTRYSVRTVGKTVIGLFLVVLLVAMLVSLVPQVVGADHSYVVTSGSMSPSIEAGSVVIVGDVPTGSIERNDVITYHGDGRQPVTHRVIDIRQRDDQRAFVTKGDNNEDPDPDLVSSNDVIGKVRFHLPWVGYVISFANTQLGLLTLVIVPAFVLGVLELWDFYRELSKRDDDTENGGVL